MKALPLRTSDRSAHARWLVAVTFGVVAVVATACVWAGLSLTDILSVVVHTHWL